MKINIRPIRWGCLIVALVFIIGLGAIYLRIEHSPKFGAQGADALRQIFGARFVARLEMTLYQVQDIVLKVKYSLGLQKPAAPWEFTLASPTPAEVSHIIVPSPTSLPTATVHPPIATQIGSHTTLKGTIVPTETPTPTPTTSSTPAITTTPTAWSLPSLVPLGSIQGEGIWQPYISDTTGRIDAYRTYLQPDPNRPYTVVAIVAFDLTTTRLHFILGSKEPYAAGAPKRSGAMPAADKAPGLLLAMFNGGFKAINGDYGAMADGVVAIPPRDGLGTIAIYKDGRVRMGEWGIDIQPSSDMEAWRQNGPPVIHQGGINPKIYDNSSIDWGFTVNNVSPTWRSGVGLSADGNTLYFFAGPSLTIEALARGMAGAGVAEAIQLDINAYWVLFDAVRWDGTKFTLESLFPKFMNENIDRYLYSYTRDFFSITVKP